MTSIWVETGMQLAALRALARELGWGRAVRLGLRARGRPDPFADLPAPADDKDRGSRDQIREALPLYAVLREELGQEEALRVVQAALLPATLAFLDHAVGEIDPAPYLAAGEAGRRAWAERLLAPFPNADSETVEATEAGLVHHVTRCRFVELCAAAGVPELAPVFCAGDFGHIGTISREGDANTSSRNGDRFAPADTDGHWRNQ